MFERTCWCSCDLLCKSLVSELMLLNYFLHLMKSNLCCGIPPGNLQKPCACIGEILIQLKKSSAICWQLYGPMLQQIAFW